MALAADENLGVATALRMENERRKEYRLSGRATSTLLLKEQKSGDSEMMHQRSRLVPMGGGGRREQNLPESGEKTAETAECFSGIAAFQRKVLSM